MAPYDHDGAARRNRRQEKHPHDMRSESEGKEISLQQELYHASLLLLVTHLNCVPNQAGCPEASACGTRSRFVFRSVVELLGARICELRGELEVRKRTSFVALLQSRLTAAAQCATITRSHR